MVYSFLRCKFEYYVKNTTRSAILEVMFLFKCKCGMDFEEKKYESTFIYPKKAQLKKKNGVSRFFSFVRLYKWRSMRPETAHSPQ